MRGHRSCGPSGPIPLIDRTAINPLDPIAYRVAVARSKGQGRRPVFRETGMSSDEARPENVSRRRSLALGRSEHDGRLAAYRDGGGCAAVPAILALLIAGAVTAGMPSGAAAEPPPARPPASMASPDAWAAHVTEAAERFEIPARWIRAVMAAESDGDARTRSPKGAIGLMQIMPTTWDELRTQYDLGSDPWEPRANILAGAAYLRQMHDRYGSIDAMLAAYNAGPQRYDAHRTNGRALPAETIDYVAKVASMIGGTAPVAASGGAGTTPTWRLAPLFVERALVTRGDDPSVADASAANPSNGPAIVDLSALTPLSDGLFVRKPGAQGERR